MSRTLGGGLNSHLATSAHTRCRMLRLDLVDGSTIAVTDHNRALTFDLGDGAVLYSPRTGIAASDLALSTGFDADDLEVTGPIVENATEAWHVTRAAVIGGRFDHAQARFFQVDWNSLGSGPVQLLNGYVVLGEVQGGRFKLTINSEIARFQQEIGRTITAYCDADFGDARCGYAVPVLAATVSAVIDSQLFAVSFTGTYADDFFNAGTVTFTSGALAGTRPVEVSDFTGGTDAGTLLLWTQLAEAPQVGDTIELRQGCGKTRTDCMVYGNIVNFRGFSDVPGTDQVLRYPNPAG